MLTSQSVLCSSTTYIYIYIYICMPPLLQVNYTTKHTVLTLQGIVVDELYMLLTTS